MSHHKKRHHFQIRFPYTYLGGPNIPALAAIGITLAGLVTSVFFFHSSPIFDLNVLLRCHMQLNDKSHEWMLKSSLDASRENYRQTEALEKELQSEGWEATEANSPGKLSYAKASTFTENIEGWKLSKTERVDILNAVVTLRPESEVILDAPKNLVIETYPPVKVSEPLAVKDADFLRMHIPLQYAVDETPYLNMTTSTQTLSGRAAMGAKWLFGEGLRWLIGVVASAAGLLVTARLIGFFGKKAGKDGV